MMKKARGTYDMEAIKYFRPVGIVLDFDCPQCGAKIEIDAGDDFIEYPKPTKTLDLECIDCGHEFALKLKIEMTVSIEYGVV